LGGVRTRDPRSEDPGSSFPWFSRTVRVDQKAPQRSWGALPGFGPYLGVNPIPGSSSRVASPRAPVPGTEEALGPPQVPPALPPVRLAIRFTGQHGRARGGPAGRNGPVSPAPRGAGRGLFGLTPPRPLAGAAEEKPVRRKRHLFLGSRTVSQGSRWRYRLVSAAFRPHPPVVSPPQGAERTGEAKP